VTGVFLELLVPGELSTGLMNSIPDGWFRILFRIKVVNVQYSTSKLRCPFIKTKTQKNQTKITKQNKKNQKKTALLGCDFFVFLF